MSKRTTEESSEPLTAEEVVKALNYHGAFLKKHVLATLRVTRGVRIINEEHALDFGGETRTSDILAGDDNKIVFVIECKKVSPEKSWIFLKGVDQHYRVYRRFQFIGPSSKFVQSIPPETPVCSEGYEYRRTPTKAGDLPAKKADQSPIFEAGGQLASAFLGFVHDRIERIKQSQPDPTFIEYYVPLLVTNARLFFINADQVELNLDTGEVASAPDLLEMPHVILKQPAASPKNFSDFRTSIGSDERNQRFQESIYVINAKSLGAFFAAEHRKFLATT
jgi:hypothetical protein